MSKIISAIDERLSGGITRVLDKVTAGYGTAKAVVQGHIALQSPLRIVSIEEGRAKARATMQAQLAKLSPEELKAMQAEIHRTLSKEVK